MTYPPPDPRHQPPYGQQQPQYGEQPGYPQPGPFPPPEYGQPGPFPPPQYGQPGPYGQPAYGQPAYGQPPMMAGTAYANWGQRAGAWLIDQVPVLVIAYIGVLTNNTALGILFILIGVALWGYNRWYQMGRTGQSWGKKVLHIKLVSEQTGAPVGAGVAFGRDILHYFVDGLLCDIGYLFPLWDSKRQTLADKIVKTVVIPA